MLEDMKINSKIKKKVVGEQTEAVHRLQRYSTLGSGF